MHKEVRNGSLIATIKTNLSRVGHVHLKTEDKSGRKATCVWRNLTFLISSKLTVREIGIFEDQLHETENSRFLQAELRGEQPEQTEQTEQTATA